MSNELRAPATAAGANDSTPPDAPLVPTAADAVELFPSLSALRTAHSSLLEAHRTQATLPDFWATVELFLRRGQATGALLDNEGDRGAAQSLLDYWTATAYSVGRKVADALLFDFDPTLAPEIPDDRCPYVGLAAFREGQGAYFFGRRQLVETLIAKVATDRLLAIVGPSGSGKSSVVLAGLLTALKAGAVAATAASAASDQWRYSTRLVPGSDPLTNLARAIQPTQGIDNFDVALAAKFVFAADNMRRAGDGLVKLVAESGLQPLVLIVDQFEELFTLCTDEGLRRAFIDNLLALMQAPGARHTVILTMRTDFESYVARLPTFQPYFDAALVRVTPLNAAELRDAIERPAALVGLKFEAGVVDGLVQDLLGEPAALPLLQFTLLKLWEQRERNRITWDAYHRLGGGRLALARSADQLYEKLIPEEQLTARRILLRLVRPGEGLEITSNRVRRAVLYQTGEARDRVDRVLDRLIDADLLRLTPGDKVEDTQVEVAHEALVRNWPRLVGWLEDERGRLRERLRLTEAAEQWLKVARDPGALLRGALLEDAQHHPDLNQVEQAFVAASLMARQTAEAEREAARQRELAQARALAAEQAERANAEREWAEYQSRSATKLRQRAWSLGLITVVALLLAGIAVWLTIIANQQNQTVNEQRAAAQTAQADALQQAATAGAASTIAVQQAATADAASTLAFQKAGTAIAAQFAALSDAKLARTAEAMAVAEQTKAAHIVAALDYTGQQLTDIQAIIDNALGTTAVGEDPTPTPRATPTPVAATALTITRAITPTTTLSLAPELTLPLTVSAALVDPDTTVLTQVISTSITGVVSTVVVPLPGITAIVPDIEVPLYGAPRDDAAVLTTLRAPLTLSILQATSYWVEVLVAGATAADVAQIGWVQAWLLTYQGDAAMLPPELRYLVINSEKAETAPNAGLPFTYGVVISVDGAAGYALRDAPNHTATEVIWSPVDTPVTLLFAVGTKQGDLIKGPVAATDEPWYFVSMIDPGGANLIWRGYLPVAVVEPR